MRGVSFYRIALQLHWALTDRARSRAGVTTERLLCAPGDRMVPWTKAGAGVMVRRFQIVSGESADFLMV